MLLAVLLVVPIQSLDAEAHQGGEGHGDGIDVVYTSGDNCILTVTLAQKPSSYPTVSVLALDGSGDDQVVEHVEPSKVFKVILTPLHIASYQVIVTIAETGELLGECILTVGGTLTVSFSSNGGSGIMAPYEVVPGSIVVLPECGFEPAKGKSFASWEVNGIQKLPGDKIQVDSDIAVKAVWEGSGEEDGISPMLIVGIVVVLIIILMIVIVLIRRRG